MGEFRERLLWVAALTTAIAVIILLVVANYAPGASSEHWTFSETYYPVVTTIVGALMSVGLISLIIELFLRQSYASSLRTFLNLKTALVRSGLFEASSDADFHAAPLISRGSTISAVSRDPQRWIQRNFEAVLSAAKKRSTTVTLLWPDPDDPNFEAIAKSLDYAPEALRSNISLALEWAQKQWSTSAVLASSRITISGVSNPQYELMQVDDTMIVSLGRPFSHHQGEAQLTLGFETNGYPVDWFKQHFEEGVVGGEMWAAEGRGSQPRESDNV